MSTCLFRLLPKHILEAICKYTMPIGKVNSGSLACTVALRTGLYNSLGPEWKEVALEHYFTNFTLTIDDSYGNVCSSHPFSDCLVPVEREYLAIKAVKICVSLKDLVSGNAAYMLAQSKYSSIVYFSVKTLYLDINEFYGSGRDIDTDSLTSTPSFYQQLLAMLPVATRVRVLTGPRIKSDIDVSDCAFEQFMLYLHDKYDGLCTTLNLKGSLRCNFASMHSTITEMRVVSDYSSQMGILIEECAPSLESLQMHVFSRQSVYNILVNALGKPIEYPRLTSLTLNVDYEPGNTHYDACPQLLMPSLANLVISRQYPFKDDVIFKSTRNTLKYVKINLCSKFAEILKKHKVFLGPSYPNLRHVEIGYGKGATPPEASDEYWAYILGIAHKVRGLSICSSFDFPTALERMLDGPMMSNIRYFKLDSVNLSFNSFCSLVEKLPNMTQFSVLRLALSSEHEYMSHVELHDHFTNKYRTLSHSLQYCDAGGGGDLNEMVKCAMLLVALCPRITRFKANTPISKPVQDAINKATAKEPFIRYADRLRHLAFNEITEDSDAFASF